MKALLSKFPTASRFVLAILLFTLALIVNGITNKGVIEQYFSFLASVCIIIIHCNLVLYKRNEISLKILA